MGEAWRQLYPMSFAIGLVLAMVPVVMVAALIALWAWISGRFIWCLITKNPLVSENETGVEERRQQNMWKERIPESYAV
jgi:hypothetical protein